MKVPGFKGFKASRNVLMLAGVYLLHLVFFQSLMAAPHHYPRHTLRTIQTHPRRQGSSSRGVGDFTQLLKHENSNQRDFHFEARIIDVTPFLTEPAPIKEELKQQLTLSFNLPDASFRLYSRIKVFLI